MCVCVRCGEKAREMRSEMSQSRLEITAPPCSSLVGAAMCVNTSYSLFRLHGLYTSERLTLFMLEPLLSARPVSPSFFFFFFYSLRTCRSMCEL